MTQELAQQLVNWLLKHSTDLKFGQIDISIIVHGGNIKRIEKSVCEKEQIE